MKIIAKEIAKHYPNWNQRKSTEEDFYEFCENREIEVIETPLRHHVKAILWFVEDEYVLTVNSHLFGVQKLLAMWHEIGHFLMHAPSRTIGTYFWGDENIYSHQNRREENEADAFALCCLIPSSWVCSKSFNDLLEEGFSENQIWKRKEIYEKHQI